MNIENYKTKYDENSTPGWDCINKKMKEVYGNQEPRHWGATFPYALGGEDPLDGLSSYYSENGGVSHEHIVTYGFSELYYDEEAFGQDYSKFGFELAFRLSVSQKEEDINWALNFLQNIAKYVFKTGNYFDDHHYMPANGPICLNSDTKIHALAFITDPELGEMQTPHGKVKFLQVVGLTQKEYERVKENKSELEKIFSKLSDGNSLLVTDLGRGEV